MYTGGINRVGELPQNSLHVEKYIYINFANLHVFSLICYRFYLDFWAETAVSVVERRLRIAHL